jgi:hypothetical protein
MMWKKAGRRKKEELIKISEKRHSEKKARVEEEIKKSIF